MIAKLKLAGMIIGVLVGITALITFLNDVRKISSASVEAVEVAKQQRWDRLRPVLVYEAVHELGENGATFDNVRSGFTSRVAPYRSQLPLGDMELEDASLRIALFDLIVAKVILPRSNNTYVAMNYDNSGYSGGNENLDLSLVLEKIDSEIINAIIRHPGAYDRESLAEVVSQSVRARDSRAGGRRDFADLVNDECSRAFASGEFTIRNGKIYPKDFPVPTEKC